MSQQEETLRAIKALRDKKFVIPHYQRGYRWGESEVRALLEDIWDFARTQNDNFTQEQFYCLQPVVVKKVVKKNKEYNVIDGQQRLTTIFLIIKYLKNENFFDISYETRQDSANFLQNIQDKSEKELENIDFYHFYKAYKTITRFFEGGYDEYKKINKDNFLEVLLEQCKVLWYKIDSKKENENDVFIRLNIGKIPLVEAENIKALFLSKNDDLDTDELKKRAKFWYESELKARENGDFRYCVLSEVVNEEEIMIEVNEENVEQRVLSDDTLRIRAYLESIVPLNKKDKNYLFNHFYKHYKKKTLNDEWDKLAAAIRTLSGFAGGKGKDKIDREIFHYFGFLIYSGESIYSLYQKWIKVKNKTSFSKELLLLIQNNFSEKIDEIEQLSYRQRDRGDREHLKNILLLFNLEYLIRDVGSREYFKFNRFVLEQWSLEHIYAQNSESIQKAIKDKDNKSIIKWLEEILLYINNDDDVKQEIEKSISSVDFDDELFNKIDESFKNDEYLHKIQNLTLLDKDSNRRIGNHIFSQKRKEIQELGEKDKLIPICTKKVFEKVFSKNKSNPDIFETKDQEDYLRVIKEYLEKYKKTGAKQ